MPTAPTQTFSFWPKEHGAYAQLAIPLAAGLLLGRPSISSYLLTLAALALFVAHEPLLVTLGARGVRARRTHGAVARRIGGAWASLAAAAGVVGIALGGPIVAGAALAPIFCLLALMPFVLRGREKTLGGELLVAAALTAAAVPVTVAGSADPSVALRVWAVWLLAFAVSTSAVRWVISSHRGRVDRASLAVAAVASVATALLILSGTRAGLAALPVVLAGWTLIVRPTHPRHLRRVGWVLAVASVLALTGIVVAFRAGGS